MDCSTPGILVLHYLLELGQTHVHWVGDAIQPSLPQLSPSPSAFYLSQHQGLFHWVGSSRQVAKVLELQYQSFQWTLSWFSLELTGLISLQSRGLSRVFSNTTVKKHQFFSAQPFLWSNSHPYKTTGKAIALTTGRASLVPQLVKNLPEMQETWVGLGRSPGEGKGYPLQYSGLENSMDWIVHGVTKSQTWQRDFHFHFDYTDLCWQSDVSAF